MCVGGGVFGCECVRGVLGNLRVCRGLQVRTYAYVGAVVWVGRVAVAGVGATCAAWDVVSLSVACVRLLERCVGPVFSGVCMGSVFTVVYAENLFPTKHN